MAAPGVGHFPLLLEPLFTPEYVYNDKKMKTFPRCMLASQEIASRAMIVDNRNSSYPEIWVTGGVAPQRFLININILSFIRSCSVVDFYLGSTATLLISDNGTHHAISQEFTITTDAIAPLY